MGRLYVKDFLQVTRRLTVNGVSSLGGNVSIGGTLSVTGAASFAAGAGFFGVTPPTTQPGPIADPTGGATVDAEARTAINSINAALRSFGIIKT